jgi:hypothetical protein
MVNVSSLPVVGGASFDLDSQVGVTKLLAAIRASEISSEHKNETRDLVFLYANGGKDATVRRSLEQKIEAFGITPVAPKVASIPLPPPPVIGTYRVSPAFTPPKAIAVKVAPATVPPPAPSIEPVAPPVLPVREVVETMPAVEEYVSTPVPVKKFPVVEVVEEVVTPPPPLVTPILSEVATPSSMVNENQDHLARIREIKSLVNEKVGNPVNLVDINNEVGREYMSALLDAMKTLNNGSSPAPTMRRLEIAFAAVEATLKEHQSGAMHSTPLPSVEEKAPIVVTPAVSEFVAPVAEPKPEPDIAFQSTPVSEFAIPTQNNWATPIPTPMVGEETNSMPSIEVPQQSGWNAVPTKPMAVPIVHSLAESEPIKTPQSLPLTRKDEVPAAVGDILHTQEVNQGLEQLLLEWSLFKKSGLFGAGPKGSEHPLFKKVAGLQIPLLLAGRFEGATQEIKQSITDYMNGWRYEQGIIYEPGELFEHYLRRVIRHILDLQKK